LVTYQIAAYQLSRIKQHDRSRLVLIVIEAEILAAQGLFIYAENTRPAMIRQKQTGPEKGRLRTNR
jgi:hypothetical protein